MATKKPTPVKKKPATLKSVCEGLLSENKTLKAEIKFLNSCVRDNQKSFFYSDGPIEECCESHLSNFKDKDGKVFCWGQTTCPKCGRWFGMTPDK